MLLVDPKHGTVTELHREKCELMSAVDRLEEEFEGWKMYKRLDQAHPDRHYKLASEQEFHHAMLAMEDVIMYLKKHCNETEKAMLHKAISA